jgi:hypothetical protein
MIPTDTRAVASSAVPVPPPPPAPLALRVLFKPVDLALDFRRWAARVLAGLAVVVLLGGCGEERGIGQAAIAPQWNEIANRVWVIHDADRGATCWLTTFGGAGFSCLPDSQLKRGSPREGMGPGCNPESLNDGGAR